MNTVSESAKLCVELCKYMHSLFGARLTPKSPCTKRWLGGLAHSRLRVALSPRGGADASKKNSTISSATAIVMKTASHCTMVLYTCIIITSLVCIL